MHELQRGKDSIKEIVLDMMELEDDATEKIKLKDELIELIEEITIELITMEIWEG